MDVKEAYRKKRQDYIRAGKIPWAHPERIERQSILNALLQAKGYAKGTVLDIGCGNKPYKIIFSGNDKKYIGTDISVSKNSPDVNVTASALELPFKTQAFDTALSIQVLEHVPEPKKMLEEIYRVLKKNSFLILTAPMSWQLHETPNDYYRFTTYGLRYLAESAGFKIIYIKARSSFWGLVGQKLSSRLYFLGGESKPILLEGIQLIFCAIIQSFCLFLDKINYNESETLGYVMVARK